LNLPFFDVATSSLWDEKSSVSGRIGAGSSIKPLRNPVGENDFPLYPAFPGSEYNSILRLPRWAFPAFRFPIMAAGPHAVQAPQLLPSAGPFSFRPGHALRICRGRRSTYRSRTFTCCLPDGSIRLALGLDFNEAQPLHSEGLWPSRRSVDA